MTQITASLSGALAHPLGYLWPRAGGHAFGNVSVNNELTRVCDPVLNRVVTSNPRVPGVVAMPTDRRANTYEGAAGKRQGVSTARASIG